MKKLRTYGKNTGREVYVNLYDKFECISDDNDSRGASPKWVKAFSTKGWYQPKWKAVCSQHATSKTNSFAKEENAQGMMASTPCSSTGAKPRKQKFRTNDKFNFQKQIFKEEIKSKLQQSFSVEESTESDAIEAVGRVLKKFSIKSESISPVIGSKINEVDVLSLEISNCLEIDKKVTGPENDSSPYSLAVQGKYSCSINTPNHADMTFLETLTPFRLQDVAKNRHTFSIDEECTPVSKVLTLCGQEDVMDINEYFTTRNVVKKIGEGLYGEVFEIVENKERVAIKVVPVEGEIIVNGESQKKFCELLSEISVSKELSNLRTETSNQVDGFIKFFGAKCCRGRYPVCLLDKWHIWDEERGSENDDPDKLNEDQHYIIFEFELGGTSLEDYRTVVAAEAKSILYQITAALAVGERALKFEHRDLHWGNVLIQKTTKRTLSYAICHGHRDICTAGMEVRIIDFTLSRLEKDECVVFSNLSDDENLFQGKGDYQFDVYRMMREDNGNRWYEFNPRSNVLWIHYTADKLINEKLTRKSKRLQQFFSRILEYECACDVLNDDYFIDR